VAQNFGAASATPSAAPGGPNLKAPGFAGGYLLLASEVSAACTAQQFIVDAGVT
jgi:hypothetical protein